MAVTDFYAGKLSDVLRVARNIEVGNETPFQNFSMTEEEAEEFMKDANRLINGKMRALYVLPLQKVTNPLETDVEFPDPIPYIAQRMAAGFMIESAYSEGAENMSQYGTEVHEKAQRDLNDLVAGINVGSQELQGQRRFARDLFLNPQTAPLVAPPNRTKV